MGSYELIGTFSTPVREIIDMAAELVKIPVACLSLVVRKRACRAYISARPKKPGVRPRIYLLKSTSSGSIEPFQRVLSVMPRLYDDLWTAAKGMYKVEPAVADGGEVIIYAPHISEVSYTHGADIDKVGYHCRDYFVKQWDKFKDAPRSVLAHSTHLNGKGRYDARTRKSKPRASP